MEIRKFLKKSGYKLGVAAMLASPMALHTSCDEDTAALIFDIIDQLVDMMGYTKDNVNDETTDDIIDDEKGLPSSKMWTQYTPPVGNQGQYGTCVAWATGYGLKTTLNRIDGRISSSNSAANQTSPVDLWHLMRVKADQKASASCGGSSFDPAFKVMMTYGVQRMSNKPFTNQKMTCDPATTVAMGNSSDKLGDYRVVAYTRELANTKDYGMTAANIKAHLAQGPLVVGAKLGERFMRWNSSNVIYTDDPDSYNGGHAYHAMMVVGYDDSKGAFRIQNSWGSSDWGDNGFIWVDYDFFIKNFAFGVWSASNDPNHYANSALRAGSGNDLAVNVLSDKENADGTRTLKFNVKNVGAQSVDLEECNMALVLYKKKHFHEKSILSNEVAKGTLAAGDEKSFSINYSIPTTDEDGYSVSGEYYMYLSVDAKDEIKDEDLSSNFAFLTGANSKPFEILDGKISGETYALHEDLANKVLGDYYGTELYHRLAKELSK